VKGVREVARGTALPRLRAVRIARLLTQQELARAAGVGFTTVNRLERGDTPAELRTVRKLAAALGVEPAALGVEPVEPSGAQPPPGAARGRAGGAGGAGGAGANGTLHRASRVPQRRRG
jgi:DNA-binding XRE family transcriptional regulator